MPVPIHTSPLWPVSILRMADRRRAEYGGGEEQADQTSIHHQENAVESLRDFKGGQTQNRSMLCSVTQHDAALRWLEVKLSASHLLAHHSFAHLQIHHVAVTSTIPQQFLVGAGFDNATIIEDNNLVSAGNCAEPVGDDKSCSVSQ